MTYIGGIYENKMYILVMTKPVDFYVADFNYSILKTYKIGKTGNTLKLY